MWKKHRSEENLIGFDEISLDPIKISPDLREIVLESGFFRRILENFGQNLEIFRSVWVLGEENRNPTRQNRFRVLKTSRRPAGVVESAGFGSDPVGSSGWSNYRMNLDNQ